MDVQKYYRIEDAFDVPERWYLGSPKNAYGVEIDPQLFTRGLLYKRNAALVIQVRSGTMPQDFTFGSLDMPIVATTVAKAIQKIAPDGIQRVPVEIVGQENGGGCKSLSVICLSSLRLHPSGVRRSEGERSEPSAAEPRRGGGAPRVKNWSRAGQAGSLLGCRETHPTQNQNDPPRQS